MAQQVQQNELQGNLAQNQANKGLQGTEDQITANTTNSIIGGAGAALGTGLMLAASDENLKTSVSPQGSADPGSSLPAPEASAAGVMPYQASQNPNGTPGLSVNQMKNALSYFRQSLGQAFAPRPITPSPQAQNPIQLTGNRPMPQLGAPQMDSACDE